MLFEDCPKVYSFPLLQLHT